MSALVNAIMVAVKVAAILLFIGVAAFHIDVQNWTPFIPPLEITAGSAAGFSWEMLLLDAIELGLGFGGGGERSEEHTSELQSLMRISYAVFCLKKKKQNQSEKEAHTTCKQ